MPALLEILEQEHSDMRRLLDLIKTEADTARTPDLDLLHEIVEYCLAYPDQYHHPKEDLIYAALRRHDPEGTGAIDDIVAEHRELAIATKEMATVLEVARAGREGTCRDLRVMLRSFVRSYRDHMLILSCGPRRANRSMSCWPATGPDDRPAVPLDLGQGAIRLSPLGHAVRNRCGQSPAVA
jgi:hypothetical protein